MSSDRIFCLWQKESSDLLISQHECYCSRHTSSSVWIAKKDYVFFKLRWKLLDRLSHSFFSSCPVWFFGKQWIFASASSVVEGRFLKGSFLFYKKLLHSCGGCVRINSKIMNLWWLRPLLYWVTWKQGRKSFSSMASVLPQESIVRYR